ncbi:ZIP family metal transporter [Haloquadratum walsbyi]|jgi:hypothetical protein|uniref:Divalent heavy-metal cations transporter n=1 Tax=Haloquadratum walsbyi J07HQW2 TaxID=1238425 RepID=U1PMA0_9EURY|nr:MAG: hypothetical protein J07HQW2_01279 [Haloquadratum walsbyi J07HQW2]
MITLTAIEFVFVAELVTAVATGIGAIPLFLFDEISDRWNVILWGLASGIMLSASGLGLITEGVSASEGFPSLLIAGAVTGVMLMILADAVTDQINIDSEAAMTTSKSPAHSTHAGGGTATSNDTRPIVDTTQCHNNNDEAIKKMDSSALSIAAVDADFKKLLLIFGVLTSTHSQRVSPLECRLPILDLIKRLYCLALPFRY